MRDDGLYHPPVADAAVLAPLFIYFFKRTQQEMCRHWNSFSFFRNNWRDNSISDIWMIARRKGFHTRKHDSIEYSSSVISTSYWHSKDYSSAGFLVKCYSHRRTITDVTINLDIHMETNSNSWALKNERNKQDYIVVPCITAEQGGNVGHLNGNVLRKSYIGRGWCYYWSSRGRLVQTAGPQCAVLIYGAPSNNLR